MLEACHERVQRTLALLGRLREHVRQQGADESARQAARDVLRYFDIAAPLHHEDEELHVFPLLLAQAKPEVQTLVQRLQQDHVEMVADWAAARAPLIDLAEGQIQAFTDGHSVLLDRFAERYADHIRHEEHQAYPAALCLLDFAALDRVGREMAVRRGAHQDG
ncbi:hemerythrin domain-containing protein [Acidovorax radicis]|uniref:hemerythrin domain-containing protein n=1 Tax=Acidovorax radicis TaxID=758826 RepID=UPI0002377850